MMNTCLSYNADHFQLTLPMLRHGVWVVCVVVLLSLLPINVVSQILHFKTYSVQDGLLSNDIEAISQDPRGYMWFGTSDGVSVFDGKSFVNYTTREGLPHNFVSQILPDKKKTGTVWMLAGGTVCVFDGHQFRTFALPVSIVHTIYPDNSGITWCGTDRGVFTIADDTIAPFHAEALKKDIFGFAEWGQNIMWMAQDTMLIRCTKNVMRFENVAIDEMPASRRNIDLRGLSPKILLAYSRGVYRSMWVDADGTLWAINNVGILFKIVDMRVVSKRVSFNNPFIYDGTENLIASYGYGGISEIAKDDISTAPIVTYTAQNGLPENTIRSAFVDKEGNTWIGGRDLGVAKLSASNVINFPISEVWVVHNIQFATADQNNHIWIIANDTLVEFWRDHHDRWIQSKHVFSRDANSIFHTGRENHYYSAVYCDHENRMWLASLKGPPQFDCYQIIPDQSAAGDTPSNLKLVNSLRLSNAFSHNLTLCFLVSRDGTLWMSIGGELGGVVHVDPTKFPIEYRIFGKAEGVSNNYVRALYEDRKGNIWGGTFNEGAVRISRDGTVKRFTTANGLPEDAVWCFTEDYTGKLLIGTANGGLAILEGDSLNVLSVREGLPSNKIYCFAEDFSHRMWMGTKIGMVYEDRPGMKTFVRNQQFMGSGVFAAGITRDSTLWFVTSNNLWIYTHLNEKRDTLPPPIYITDLKVSGMKTEINHAANLAYDENRLEVGYVGISFKDESAVRYLYRLRGTETDWQGPTYNTSVTYGQLYPGSYVFEVKAINIDGTISAQPAVLPFTIFPPFWQTWWFYGLCGFGLAVSVFLIANIRTRRYRAEKRMAQGFAQELIESQEKERKRVAGELHDDLGQELMVIINRAQMGIIKSDDATTKNQFQEIAKTASKAVENVREMAYNLSPYHLEQLGLIDSIKAMIEKISGVSAITFALDLHDARCGFTKDEDVNIYRIIQECVNNIVKHSAATHAGISLKHRDSRLELTVQDNGKGFDMAARTLSSKKRRGFGLVGLSERVNLLKGSLAITSTLTKGTTVTIRIPCRNSGETQ